MLAARSGPTMLARMAVMRALNRGYVPEVTESKGHHWAGQTSRGTNDRLCLRQHMQAGRRP